MSPAATVSGALGLGAPDAAVPAVPAAELLGPVVLALDELVGVLLQPVSTATEQTMPGHVDRHHRVRVPARIRRIPLTRPDPHETAMRTAATSRTGRHPLSHRVFSGVSTSGVGHGVCSGVRVE